MHISPQNTSIGWIGTGVMGRAMCEHLINVGYKMTVFNRTSSKLEPLLQLGAKQALSPAEVAKESDVVISIVGYPQDVRQVILGDDGVLAGMKPEGVIIDMTTSEPQLAKDIYNKAQAKSIASIDAPVSGGDVGAQNATLAIMAGGDLDIFNNLMPIWQTLGKSFTYMGAAGSGQHTKMANQIAISSTMVAMVESLLYAHKAGLDLSIVLEAMSGGAAGSWSLSNYAPRIIKRDFNPGFFVDHFVKDLKIALDEAGKMQLSLPGLALAHQLYIALQAQGHGKLGTQSLMLALEGLSGCNI